MVLLFDCKDFVELYQCKLCGLSTNEKTRQLFHNCESKNKSEVTYLQHSCEKCDSTSHSMLWMFAHQTKHNQDENEDKYNKVIVKIKNLLKTGTFECDQCACSFTKKIYLKMHLNVKHLFDDKAIWYKCGKCNWKTQSAEYLKVHCEYRHVVRGDEMYKCSECLYQTRTKRALATHRLCKHTPDHLIKWYKCYKCDFKAKIRCNLLKHIKRIHPSDGPRYKCGECVYQTHKRSDLIAHLMSKHAPKL